MKLLQSCGLNRFLNSNGRFEILKNARRLSASTTSSHKWEVIINPSKTQEKTSTSSQSRYFSAGQPSQDLRRFLEEVGTDPREARYWLQQFQQREVKPDEPFAVVEVSPEVFSHEEKLNKLASCLAFLHRNGMPIVIVHGIDPSRAQVADTPTQSSQRAALKISKEQLMEDNIRIVDLLEKNGAKARPFMCSSHVLHAATPTQNGIMGVIDDVDARPLKWFLNTGHIPVLSAVGETTSGQVVCVDPTSAAIHVADALHPTKVIFLNTEGGLRDQEGEVLDHISVPDEVGSILKEPWLGTSSSYLIQEISNMLLNLPMSTSAVITSADTLITELFTHHGSGTLFQSSEPITAHHSLCDVKIDKLRELLVRSFDKALDPDYFSTLENELHTIYISERYSAAAIITTPEETEGVPYLDKFTICKEKQGQGTSDNLWRRMRGDFSQLCWRSRTTNRINPWYFVRSTGSWTNGAWTVFWYGVSNPQQTHKLVTYANSLPSSFDPIAPHDERKSKRVLPSNAYHKYL